MSGLKLWLIRHGETEVNAGSWSARPAATHLTSLGRTQAKKVASQVTEQPSLLITSPLSRAKETAQYILNQWPVTPSQTWPIQEFTYLSPHRLLHLNAWERKEEIKRFWLNNDPYYIDGEDAESFAAFLQRVLDFHTEIMKQQGFVVVVGHGQFFKAYQLGLIEGFKCTPQWMNLFRQQETENPIKNSGLLKFDWP